MTDQTQHNLDNAATDAYFAARPKLDCLDRRRVYEAGFKKALEAQQERIAALEAENEAEKLMNHTLRHNYMSAQAELAAAQLLVKELREAVAHSVNQARIIGNDYRRELDLLAAIAQQTDDTSALDKLEAGYQTRIKEMREALETHVYLVERNAPELSGKAHGFAKQALSTKDNDEALRRYVAGYFRKAADAWEYEVRDWLRKVAEQIERGEVK